MYVYTNEDGYVFRHSTEHMSAFYNSESVVLVVNKEQRDGCHLSLRIDRWSGKAYEWKFISRIRLAHEYKPVISERFLTQLLQSITKRSNLMVCSSFGEFKPYGGYGISKAISGLKVAKLMGCLNPWPHCIVQLAYDAACYGNNTMHWNIYRIFYKYSIRKIILGGEDNYINNVRWLKKAMPEGELIKYDSHDVTNYFMKIMTW